MVTIRPLLPEDRAGWEPLWLAYLRFYRSPLPAPVTEATFARLVGRRDGLAGLLAVDEAGIPIGLAHTVAHASTWEVEPSCYLHDLYVSPEARGTGVAQALIEAVTTAAGEGGSTSVYWMTQEYNGRARSLYDVVGHRLSYVVYSRSVPSA